MSERNEQRELEEAVVPVGRSSARSVPGPVATRPLRVYAAPAIAVVLLVSFVAVFFALPRWVEERAESAASPAIAPVAATEPAEPELSPEELAALQDRAERQLAALLQQQQQLDTRSAMSWGGETWERYQEDSKLGDEAYLIEDYAGAANHYGSALELGESLLGRSGQIIESALAAGNAAFGAGNSGLAVEQFDVVLGIDPDNDAARAGRARAERLPDVLELIRHGDELRQAGDLAGAKDAYREALGIDSAWSPARKALADVTAALAASSFDQLISKGLTALAEEDYSEALEHFSSALRIRPDSEVARDGLSQAEQGQKLDAIALAEVRGLAYERRELWNEAIARYEEALAADPSVAFALEGLQRSRKRADLDQKLENLIRNPNLLLTDTVLEDARRLLGEAQPLAGPESRIAGQVERLGQLVALAATPVTVQLHSDQLTEVTVYRVGKLGVFSAKEIQIRPGTYTAVGSRDGYRDVRRTFTVLPGQTVDPVNVVCNEPI